MDITRFDPKAASDIPQTMRLINPFTRELLRDDDGNPVEFQMYGIQSSAGRNASAQRNRKQREKLSDDETAKLGAEFLAALTVGWSDNLDLGDDSLPFSKSNAAKLYVDQDWIARQALEFVTDIENYSPKF